MCVARTYELFSTAFLWYNSGFYQNSFICICSCVQTQMHAFAVWSDKLEKFFLYKKNLFQKGSSVSNWMKMQKFLN